MLKIEGIHNWIGNLPDKIQCEIRQRMSTRNYECDQSIYLVGEQGREIYQLISGRVRFCNYTASGREIVMQEFREGDCFGEMSLISNQPRSVCAYSSGQSTLGVLQKSDFDDLYNNLPEIPIAINKMLVYRSQLAYNIIEDASLLTLKQRLIKLLSRLVYSHGEYIDDDRVLIKAMTHEKLAKMLGSSRQAITRDAKSLEKEGFISTNYGKIVINDLEKFTRASSALSCSESLISEYPKNQ